MNTPAAHPAVASAPALTAASAAEALLLAESCASVREAAQKLRERFAPMRVVVVDAFDMRGETPAAAGAKRAVYFGASDGHCWQVTSDPAQAVGWFITDKA